MKIPKAKNNDKAPTVILGIGSNQGDRFNNLVHAIEKICNTKGIALLACSSLYESAAVDFEAHPFYNLTLAVSCNYNPLALLDITQNIEIQYGKPLNKEGIRSKDYLPRKIDIDILYFGNKTLNNNRLIIPHPLINNRLFVIKPLLDIKFLLPSLCNFEQETMNALVTNQEVYIIKNLTEQLLTILKRKHLID